MIMKYKYKIIQIESNEVLPAIVDGKDVFALVRGHILSKLYTKPIFAIKDLIEEDESYVFFYLEYFEDETCDDRKEVQNGCENM